jgi:hypothetical protein
MPTRFEGSDRGQVHWTCGLGSLNRGAQDGTPRAEFLCVYHDTATRNHRELEDEIEKDSEGKITIKRQRGNTQVMQKLVSDFWGEIEESCLLICHFYLPMKRADIYRHKILSARCPLADVLSSACGFATTLPPESVSSTAAGEAWYLTDSPMAAQLTGSRP